MTVPVITHGSKIGIHAIYPRQVIPLDGTGEKDVSAFFGYAPISSFRVAANVDALRIDTVTFSPVPEPGALGLFACGLGGLVLCLRRR